MSEVKDRHTEDTMSKLQLAVKIDEKIRTDLKIMAIRKGTTMNELVERYLAESLLKESEE